MLPNILLGSFMPNSSRKKKTNGRNVEVEAKDLQMRYSIPFNNRDSVERQTNFSLRAEDPYRKEGVKTKKKGEMATNKVSNFSDLIQRVAASCLLHPLASSRHNNGKHARNRAGDNNDGEDDYEYGSSDHEYDDEGGEEEEEEEELSVWNEEWKKERQVRMERVRETEMMMVEVFEAVSEMKRAYVSLQEAHCPWDPEKMRVADVAVVAELRRLGVLRERFRRSSYGGTGGGGGGGVGRNNRRGGGGFGGGEMLREVVAPYEAAVEELKREVKAREADVENLKEKLRSVSSLSNNSSNGKKGRSHHQSKRRVSCSSHLQVAVGPTPDLFEATMSQVKETSKSFTSLLLSLMRSAHWDIAAAVRSIEVAFTSADTAGVATTITNVSSIHHAKYALESYVSRKIFQGFDHETFYMDGSLSSILQPDQFRKDCFAQYRDMKAMDPMELLGILPTCHFGKFCSRKYLSIVHAKMEESLFGDLEQQRQVLAGNHPRSEFYGEFLGLAKAVWLLHLLAFSLEPSPSHFEASRGAEFHPQYMESVVKFSSGRVPVGQIVGFPVSPGFKFINGSVIKSRVYLASRT